MADTIQALRANIRSIKDTIARLEATEINTNYFYAVDLDGTAFEGPIVGIIAKLQEYVLEYGLSCSLQVYHDDDDGLHFQLSYKLGESPERLRQSQEQLAQIIHAYKMNLADYELRLAEAEAKMESMNIPPEVAAWIKSHPEDVERLLER